MFLFNNLLAESALYSKFNADDPVNIIKTFLDSSYIIFPDNAQL